MTNKRSIDMTSIFKPEAIKEIKAKKIDILTFNDKDGLPHHWKIKLTKDNRVLGKEIQMGLPEGLMVVEEGK